MQATQAKQGTWAFLKQINWQELTVGAHNRHAGDGEKIYSIQSNEVFTSQKCQESAYFHYVQLLPNVILKHFYFFFLKKKTY